MSGRGTGGGNIAQNNEHGVAIRDLQNEVRELQETFANLAMRLQEISLAITTSTTKIESIDRTMQELSTRLDHSNELTTRITTRLGNLEGTVYSEDEEGNQRPRRELNREQG